MAERAKVLSAEYCPEKIINNDQARQLNESFAAYALIGRGKSAVLVRINRKNSKQDWWRIFFHEYMHIFCAKSEIDGEHFIDIYGSGHTLEIDPIDKEYDGFLNAGYGVWSEFIAQYYALKKTEDSAYSFTDIAGYAYALLREVSFSSDSSTAQTSFAMACACLLTCDDGDLLSNLVELKDIDSKKNGTELALRSCLEHLNGNLQHEKPWKINEEFISELGEKFVWFKVMNCFSPSPTL